MESLFTDEDGNFSVKTFGKDWPHFTPYLYAPNYCKPVDNFVVSLQTITSHLKIFFLVCGQRMHRLGFANLDSNRICFPNTYSNQGNCGEKGISLIDIFLDFRHW